MQVRGQAASRQQVMFDRSAFYARWPTPNRLSKNNRSSPDDAGDHTQANCDEQTQPAEIKFKWFNHVRL